MDVLNNQIKAEILERELSDDSIQMFHNILSTQFTNFQPINVNLMGLFQFLQPVQLSQHIQILPDRPTVYNNSSSHDITHWVTFYYNKGIVHVYDSINRSLITPDQYKFLEKLFPKNMSFRFHKVQQQTNGIDCGVFAIAFASALAMNIDPAMCEFNISEMRQHLLTMFNMKQISLFPVHSPHSAVSVSLELPQKEEGCNISVKKRRGRPKNVILDDTDVNVPTKKMRGRPKKVILPDDSDMKERHRGELKKKKRGHPKKAILPDDSDMKGKKKGRPKRTDMVNEIIPTQESIGLSKEMREEEGDILIKKKRGRPKKASLPHDSDMKERKRGRPKRSNIVSEIISAEESVCVSKETRQKEDDIPTRKKRGRPEKVAEPGKMIVDIQKFSIKLHDSKLTIGCNYCGALLFHEERGRTQWCCKSGMISKKLNALNANFYSNEKFCQDSRTYNNLFAFSALGASGGFHRFDRGPSLVKIQGRIYHRVFDLSHKESINNSVLYIDDGKERLNLAKKMKIDTNIVQEIENYMNAVNPLIKVYKQLSLEESDTAHIVFQQTNRSTHGPVLGDQPRSEEIAGIIKTNPEADPRKVVVWKKNNRRPQFVHFLDPAYECLQYPLLFPHASAGWSIDLTDTKGKKISQQKYYRYLLLSEKRFTSMARLGQEYFVDMWCRTEEERLQYLKHNQQHSLRVATRSEIDETVAAEGGPKVGKIYLPSSFTHGPRYMQVKYQDGMAIVSRLGKPTYFITVTCNPRWPEITVNLEKGQSAVDRPDLTCRVFQLKLSKFIKLLRAGHIFGKMVSILYVIEFQKRGLPHAHIALRVEGGGPKSAMEIDKFVMATIPDEKEYGGVIRERVLSHMVHGPCGLDKPEAMCTENLVCKKGFPKPIVPNTFIDERGYVQYKRPSLHNVQLKNKRTINDQWIVPYNPQVLMIMDCHCNVELASTVKIIKYLFKYIHKGPDMAKMTIVESEKIDEIEEYVSARYISASEAIWRILEYDVSGRYPAVNALPVHLPGQDTIIFEEGREKDAAKNTISKLNLYFQRPHELDRITYLDFYEQYIITLKESKNTIFIYPDEKHFLSKRVRGECVSRMFWVSPTLGEVYYLRLLLARFPAFSFSELKTFENQVFQSFQEAAYARGLLDDEREFKEAITEAAVFKTASGLRGLFFNLIMSGAPAALLWSEFKEIFAEDYLEKYNGNENQAFNKTLSDIDRMLRCHGKTTIEVGLPEVIDDTTELSREYLRWDTKKLNAFISNWEPLLNCDQQKVYKFVVQSILGGNANGNLKVYIDGPGGTGKTVLLNLISAKLRSEGLIVLCTASVGIAALNYEGGCTAHSMFKIPVESLTNDSVCNLSSGSQRANLIRNTALIIWDEICMTHKHAIHAVDRTIRDFDNKDSCFGSRNIIFAGDFRQIPPVIKSGTKEDIIHATVKFSPLWKYFQKFQLTIAERSKSNPNFSKQLLAIGEGRIEEIVFNNEIVAPLQQFKYVFTIQELINFIYPPEVMDNHLLMSKRAILATTNKSTDEFNDMILQKEIQGETITLYSADSIVIDEKSNPDNKHISADVINEISVTGIPDHKINIKLNAMCILIRNLNFQDGLVNGTKVFITKVHKFLLEVVLPGCQSKTFLIPRVNFKFQAGNMGVHILRRQYPIRLAYAITINKSQGQTLDVVGVDLREHVFAHGQLYVALSRARHLNNICILTLKNRIYNDNLTTANIVYKCLL